MKNLPNQSSQYHSLEISSFKLDGGAMFGIIPKPLWEKSYPCDAQNRIQLALRLLLIQTKNKKILIDTGIGFNHQKKFANIFDINHKCENFIQALKEINLTPEDITDLVLSHLHFDHAGGLITNDNITFKNATIHLHELHFEYAKAPSLRDSGSFHKNTIIKSLIFYRENGQLHFLNKKDDVILTDKNYQLKYICSHGHTPYMIHPYDHKIMYLADLIPTSRHLPIPWVMGYDLRPAITTEEKKRMIHFILEQNLKVIFEHDINTTSGFLKMEQEGKVSLVNTQTSHKQNIFNEIIF